MARIMRRLIDQARRFIERVGRFIRTHRVVSLKTDKPYRGKALLSYVIDPFLLAPGEPIPNTHTSYWESLQIAKTFLELGYSVDVISYKNWRFRPTENYAFFIDIRWNMQRLAGRLNRDCVKIAHFDTAHILFHDTAEMRRLLALQQRRGVTIVPRRFETPNLGIEHADCATVLGNDFTVGTLRYAGKPIYRVPISTPVLYPWPDRKDFESCRSRFLWLSSYGMVHKGLDLLLDAFAQMPEHHLVICGPVQGEDDFEFAYHKELHETPNVRLVGWVDIASDEFIEIANSCVGLVYASCSEGQSGAVVTCLHAGLIPIVSRESGVDVDSEFGLILETCSVEEIMDSVRKVASHSADELQRMSRAAWTFARTHHTRTTFARAYRSVVEEIIEKAVRPD